MKPKIIVSRCLLGINCRYDGKSKPQTEIIEFFNRLQAGQDYISICPETDGGLTAPRAPGEIIAAATADVLNDQGKVRSADGQDYTAAFLRGANIALSAAERLGATVAILKAKSPSCGVGQVYDGSFSRSLRPDDGITAQLLRQHGLKLFTENNWADFLNYWHCYQN